MPYFPQYDNIPWELISSSFQDALTSEESAELAEWISSDPANLETYGQLKQLWAEEVAGYTLYRQADGATGWDELRERMHAGPTTLPRQREFSPIRKRKMIRWVAAAVILIALAFSWDLYFSRRHSTDRIGMASAEKRTLALPDGSVLSLQPGASIRLDKDFNGSGRRLFLEKGKVFFNVRHSSKVFTVEAGGNSIRDIGTSFMVEKGEMSILVSVLSGRVVFSKNSTGEARELAAGMELLFNTSSGSFGTVILTGFIGDSSRNLLKFENTPLSDVIITLQKMTGKKISLDDPGLGSKLLTARLDRESFDNAIKIICTSLELTYIENAGSIILKPKMGK